jgi:hypothetical protein
MNIILKSPYCSVGFLTIPKLSVSFPVFIRGQLWVGDANRETELTSKILTLERTLGNFSTLAVIPATQEAEVRRISVGIQPGQIVLETPS